MIITDNSKTISFNKRQLSPEEINNVHIPQGLTHIKTKIVEIDGIYYYSKQVDDKEILNELIGTYLSKLVDLDAVDYQIGINNGNLYALSQLFYDDKHTYTNCYDYYGSIAEKKLTTLQSDFSRIYLTQLDIMQLIDKPKMIKQILKLTNVDLKTGQIDRHNKNITIQIEKATNKTALAKLYDFSLSYEKEPPYPEFYYYDNPFLMVRKNKISLHSLAKKYPDILESAEKLYKTEIEDVLEEIATDKQIIITDQERLFYANKDKQFNKVLRKLF